MSVINRSRLHRSQLQGLDLLGKQSVRNAIPVAEAAVHAAAPGEDGAVGGDSEAVFGSRRNGDDALPCQGPDLLGLLLALIVAVAQLAKYPPPQLQTVPSAVRARLWCSPADTATTRWPANASIFLGSRWFSWSPWPKLPKHASPQLQRAPLAVRARL